MNTEKSRFPRLWENSRNAWVDDNADGEWRVSDMIDAVKDCPVKEMDLTTLDLSSLKFSNDDVYEFGQHMRHVLEADLRHPVIMDHKGCVLDGRHRIVKALMLGKTTIKYRVLVKGSTPTRWK